MLAAETGAIWEQRPNFVELLDMLGLMSGTRHMLERPFEAVVAVGSLGGLPAFQTGLSSFPRAFPAAVIFDLHRAESGFTAHLLASQSALPVRAVVNGDPPEAGVLYLAPADRQLLITEERTLRTVDRNDDVQGHATADLLLSSAARAYGSRLIAVVLSGRLEGGAMGVRTVKQHGGRVLVQEPATAAADSMPKAALATGCVDFALPPQALGMAVVALCSRPGAADLFRVRLNTGVRS